MWDLHGRGAFDFDVPSKQGPWDRLVSMYRTVGKCLCSHWLGASWALETKALLKATLLSCVLTDLTRQRILGEA